MHKYLQLISLIIKEIINKTRNIHPLIKILTLFISDAGRSTCNGENLTMLNLFIYKKNLELITKLFRIEPVPGG